MNQSSTEQELWSDSSIVAGGSIFTSTQIVVWVVLITIGVAFLRKLSAKRDPWPLPPGPRGWPVVGSFEVLQLGASPHISMQTLAKRYGPIFLMKIGMVRALVLSSPDMATEVLKTHDRIMSGRPKTPAAYHAAWDKPDMFWTRSTRYWGEGRRLCSAELLAPQRLQKPDFQDVRRTEIELLVHFLRREYQQNNDRPVDMTQCIKVLMSNIIWRMVLGRRAYNMDGSRAFGNEDNVGEILDELFKLLTTPNISDFIPFLTPLDITGLQKRGRILSPKLDKFLQSVIDEHSPSLSKEFNPIESQTSKGTFVEELLKMRIKNLKSSNSDLSDKENLSINGIKSLVMNMISVASATPTTAFDWVFAEIVRNPHIMAKAQAELDAVVGPNRLVTEADIPHLKYMQAIVKESLRLHAAPLVGPHLSSEECRIAGYRIPANTQIFVNVYSIHRDPSVWDQPLKFDPERFLNSDIDMQGSRFDFFPFGSGKRMCPAFHLSLFMMHHALAQLLHAFTWEPPKGQKLEDVDVTSSPGYLQIRATPLYALPKLRLDHNVYESIVTN